MISDTKKTLFYLGCAVIFIGLGYFAYLGIFNRYYADDWCYNKDLNRLGLTGTLQGYTTIKTFASNRYSLTLFSGIIYSMGIFGVQSMTALTLVTWTAGMTWTLDNLKTINRGATSSWSGLLIASIIVYYTAYLAPHPYQNLYWRSGLLPYTMPIALIPVITGAITQQIRLTKVSTPLIMISAASTLLAGGFSEAAGTTLVTGLGLITLATAIGVWQNWKWGRKTIWIAGITWGFAILALILLIISPANEARQLHSYGTPTKLTDLPRLALTYTYFYLRVTTSGDFLPFLAIGGLTFSMATLQHLSGGTKVTGRLTIQIVILVGIVACLLVAASLTPSLYIEGGMPASRALIIPLFTLICATAFVGWNLGAYLGGRIPEKTAGFASRYRLAELLRLANILIFLLGILFSTYSVFSVLDRMPIYKERAAIWDERDQYILDAAQQGIEDVGVTGIDSHPVGGLHDIKPDEKHWVNRCAALYYGVKSIRASNNPD